MKAYYIYILTNQYNTVFYVGVTNNLIRRVYEHKNKLVKGFTSKYNLNKLVYYEVFSDVRDAIYREKQIKSWNRKKKIEMIEKFNPEWKDLYEEIIW
jgi:putative endonuclease